MKYPPVPPDAWGSLAGADPEILRKMYLSSPVDEKGRYLHWDEVRRRRPPEGLNHEQWWAGMWVSRRAGSFPLSLVDTAGKPFRFGYTGPIWAMVHRIDQRFGDHFLVDTQRAGDRLRSHLVDRLVEEAITSSQLEGAATTRAVAGELLRSGRNPRTRSEQMILNNYWAMEETVALAEMGEPLNIDTVCQLHKTLTHKTLDREEDEGRPQQPDDDRVGIYWDNDLLLHQPPAASELPERMEMMCQFVNGAQNHDDMFLHPLVRAIVLHFWLAHDHPFADGNGRTARALFYWSILRSGYSSAPYISISSILRKAPARYARSFLHVYTDDNDLTYFVVHQLTGLERAIDALEGYVDRKRAETAEIGEVLGRCSQLNHRQQSAILRTMGDRRSITVNGHSQNHRVTNQTARTDLLGLAELGLFDKTRTGKKFLFEPVPDLPERLRQLAERSTSETIDYRSRESRACGSGNARPSRRSPPG